MEGGWRSDFNIRDPKCFKTIILNSRILFIDIDYACLDGFIIKRGNAGCADISNGDYIDNGGVINSIPRSISRSRSPSEITGNVAYCGGGIYCKNSSPVISNCEVRYNRALHAGGGIYCLDSSPIIVNCTIAKNEADDLGGGICCFHSLVTIINSTISENTAFYAGGVACEDSTFLSLTNCTVWENEASSYGGNGGGIRSQNSSLDLINATFWRNSGLNGGAVFSKDSVIKGKNSIFWKDTPNEISCDANSNCTIIYSVIEGGFGDPNDTHNKDENPLFEDPNSRNFRLSSDLITRSPCIDAGIDTNAPIVDKNGVPRPYDGDCNDDPITDIGAYEYIDNQEPVPAIEVLPDIVSNDKVVLDPPTAMDNCAGSIEGITDKYVYYNKGPHLVNWTYHDGKGNVREQEQKVIIKEVLFVGPGQLYTSIQNAIDQAENGDTIKVASGNYTDSNTISVLGKKIVLEGGWNADFSQKDSALYPTKLSGQSTGAVMSFIDCNYSLFNGFIIEGSGTACGSGIYCLNSSPTISNCIISGNSAVYGGGIYCQSSSPSIIQCFIHDNTANNKGGGIYWTEGSQPTILSCVFYKNSVQGVTNHVSESNNGDIQLVTNGDFEKICILRYNNLSDLGDSCYKFFGKSCRTDLIIQEDDIAVIFVQP